LLYPTIEGQAYTISADVEITDGDFSGITVLANYSFTNPSYSYIPIEDGKITRTYTAYDTVDNNRVLLYAGPSGSTRGNGVIFRNIKIEKGDVATDWTPAPEDNPYDILENNLYKTNILLSEPLRSVGDVKDRLFRDSDGLWKVERNVGEMIVDDTTNVAVYPNYNTTTLTSFQVRIPSDRGTKTVEVISSHFESTRSGWNKSEDSVSVSTAGGITNIWIQCEKTFASKVSELISKNVTLQWELQAPTTETLPEELQTELNNIASFSKGNYVYTLQPDKSEILSPEVLEELTPTLHATFKGGGWYNRWKTEQDLIKQQEDIDNKTDQEVTDEIQDKIDEMESIKADKEDIDLINDMIEEYGKLLENESERVDLATGEIVELMNRVPILENNLGEFSERWTF